MSDRWILIETNDGRIEQPASFDDLASAKDELARRTLRALHMPWSRKTFFEAKQELTKEGIPDALEDTKAWFRFADNTAFSAQIFDRYPMPKEWMGHSITEDEEIRLRNAETVTLKNCVNRHGTKFDAPVRYGRIANGTYGIEPMFGAGIPESEVEPC